MQSDSGKTGGFFNKMMHMVRGAPTASGVEGEPDTDALNASQALQEGVERKRRNDAIRQQEFAHLRQLRQRHEAVGHSSAGNAASAEGFLPSLLGQETRSSETLQKIDEIEAQMSGQWWRQPGAAASAADKSAKQKPLSAQQWSALPILGEESVVPGTSAAGAGQSGVPSSLPLNNAQAPGPAPIAQAAVAAEKSFEPHPDLEEAAILFAHGDIQGARTRLLEQLSQLLSVEGADAKHISVLWHTVLDLCRAVGDEDAFEPLAIDYAEHFGRSAPLWSSLPGRLGMAPLYGTEQKSVSRRRLQWASPAMLTVGAIHALRTAHQDAPQPWCMSWLRLNAIDEVALAPLAQLLTDWADQPGQFVMSDAGKVLALLEEKTPLQDANCAPQWWVVRMALLRLMHRMDAYEQVALDYCITYEVSPPSWVPPQCHCVVQEEGEADISILQEATTLLSQSTATTHSSGASLAVAAAGEGLFGVIEGDAQARLDALSEQVQSGQVLEVSCENLIRLDFVAAGSVLNWAAEMQAKGVSLRFTRLHQLVAVFFCIIGIQEHAVVKATVA